VAYPYDENLQRLVCLDQVRPLGALRAELPEPEARGDRLLAARTTSSTARSRTSKGIFWQGSDWLNQLTNINKEIEAIRKLDADGEKESLVVCMDSTITPSGIWADYLLPIATHFERHDVALPWYKGHYYIHRPKVIEPLGESKTDFQVFTELAYRLALDPGSGFGQRYNPRADARLLPANDGRGRRGLPLPSLVDGPRVMHHQGVTMSWEEFKKRGVYKFKLDRRTSPSGADREGRSVPTPSGKIEIFSTNSWADHRLDQDAVRLRDSGDPEMDRAVGVAQPPEDEGASRSISSARIRVMSARTRSSTTSAGCARPTSRR
jgi:anaerobic selenocysteine-containing dehydrogenase